MNKDKEIYEKAKARNNELIADLITMLSLNGYSYKANLENSWHSIIAVNGYSLDWYFRVSCHRKREGFGFSNYNVNRLKVNIHSPLSNRARTFMEPKTGYKVNKIFAALLDLLTDIETNKKKNLESEDRQEKADKLRAELKKVLPPEQLAGIRPLDDGKFKLGLRLTENEVIAFIAIFRSSSISGKAR